MAWIRTLVPGFVVIAGIEVRVRQQTRNRILYFMLARFIVGTVERK